jgi:hypothetical protein
MLRSVQKESFHSGRSLARAVYRDSSSCRVLEDFNVVLRVPAAGGVDWSICVLPFVSL